MSSSRLPVSEKAVVCSCPVLHESVIYRCSLSGESVADHSLGKEENQRKGVKNSFQFSVLSSQLSGIRGRGEEWGYGMGVEGGGAAGVGP
jgi:hypothetical protein